MKWWQKIFLAAMVWVLAIPLAPNRLLMAKETPLRGKRITIGCCSWWTEQTSFKDITAKARKENKPVLAVFSASWCKPCQEIKKKVFQSAEFKQVAERVVLLYIEGTTAQGKKLAGKYKVTAYPAFKLFSKKGMELDTGHPERTVQGFLHWIKEVEKGNSFYHLSQKLEQNPSDRQTLIEITARMTEGNIGKKREYLERAIALNRSFTDPLSQQAYEQLCMVLLSGLPGKKDKRRNNYLNRYKPVFKHIVDAYYPDGFNYKMKGFAGLWTMISWFREASDHDRAIKLFNDYLNQHQMAEHTGTDSNMSIAQALPLLSAVFPSFLQSGHIKEGKKWLAKVEEIGKRDKKAAAVRGFAYHLFNMYRDIISFYGKKGNISEGERYAASFYDLMEQAGNGEQAEETAFQFAAHYGIFAERVLKGIDEQLKRANDGKKKSHLIAGKAKVLAATGKKEQARHLLVKFSKDDGFFRTLSRKEQAGVLNVLAWTMVEMDMIDSHTLEMAKRASDLYPDSGMILDTLACAYAGLNQYDKAIDIEKEAIKKLENPAFKEDFLARINEWKQKIK